MKSKYNILFSIEVLHNFYSTGRWKEIRIVPLPETKKLLKQLEYSSRQIGNEFFIIAKTNKEGKIIHEPRQNEKFSFMLIPQTLNYLNFTNLPVQKEEIYVYHFHNLNGNEFAGKHFLTAAISDYSNTVSFQPGNFVKAQDGNIYEAIKTSLNKTPDISDGSKEFWFKHDGLQFVNANDFSDSSTGETIRLEQTSTIYNFKTSVRRQIQSINVFAFNFTSKKFDTLVFSDEIKTDDEEGFDLVQVNLTSLASGKYKVTVSDEVKFIYLNLSDEAEGMPMLIDIFNLPASHPQALIDGNHKMQNRKFTIAFAARRVLWRYKTRTDTINKIEDSNNTFEFEPNGLRAFISKKPIPFSDTPQKQFRAKQNDTLITTPLPNPLPDRLLDKQNEIYKTEIFINH